MDAHGCLWMCRDVYGRMCGDGCVDGCVDVYMCVYNAHACAGYVGVCNNSTIHVLLFHCVSLCPNKSVASMYESNLASHKSHCSFCTLLFLIVTHRQGRAILQSVIVTNKATHTKQPLCLCMSLPQAEELPSCGDDWLPGVAPAIRPSKRRLAEQAPPPQHPKGIIGNQKNQDGVSWRVYNELNEMHDQLKIGNGSNVLKRAQAIQSNESFANLVPSYA